MSQLRHALLCAMLLALSACGDDPNDPSNSEDEPVEIEYLGQSGDFDSIELVLHRADGTIVSTQALATAKAPVLLSERLPSDGMVTVILRRGDRLDLETVTGLQPGDHLLLGERAAEPNTASSVPSNSRSTSPWGRASRSIRPADIPAGLSIPG